jgi:hypothetical protein
MSPRSILIRALPLLFAAGIFVSASAHAQVQPCPDHQPVVRVKSGPDFQAGIGVAVHIDVTAIDYDGDAITGFTADTSGLPAGNDAAFITVADNQFRSFTWTPQPGQAGTYTVTFSAFNTLTGSASARIIVVDTAGAPHVQAPALISSAEGTPIAFTIYAGDPDGEPIQSLTAAPLPSGASFATNMSNTAAGFSWTPGFTQGGSWSITFTAVSSSSGSATTSINVTNGNRAPVVTAPATKSGTVGSQLIVDVSAVSPDDEVITSLTTSPSPPPGASFTPCYNGPSATGRLTWTPTQAGTFNVTFIATTSSGLAGAATTSITVAPAPGAPVVTAPSLVNAIENVHLAFTVTAATGDGSPISSLTGAPLPAGATFTANTTNTSGTFDWTPSFSQAGVYHVTFTAIANGISGSATTTITFSGDRAPVVTAPQTATTSQGVLLTFSVAAGDPDGDPITSLVATNLPAGAMFTSNTAHTSGTFSWTPSSSQEGNYNVTFTASNTLTGSWTTQITVTAVTGVVAARAFLDGADKTIKLASSKPTWCVTIEIPPGSAVQITDLDPSTVVLRSAGTGSVDHIAAIGGKSAIIGDRDNNMVPDVTLCFRKADLRLLFSNLTGKTTVPVVIEGSTATGLIVRASLDVDVQAGGGHAVASISPNPLNPSGTLRFETSRAGAVRVLLFDAGGRMVREVLRGEGLPAGAHEVRVDARDASGRPLASGVYFFRIDSADGRAEGRVAVLK